MFLLLLFFFFKQKTAYELRISDWSSDVCSSDLGADAICWNPRCDRDDASQRFGPPQRRLRTAQQLDLRDIVGTQCLKPRFIARCRIIGLDAIDKGDRTSVVEGKSVSVRVDLGGRRIIKKKNYTPIRYGNSIH